jgi:ankyrin repeat protein
MGGRHGHRLHTAGPRRLQTDKGIFEHHTPRRGQADDAGGLEEHIRVRLSFDHILGRNNASERGFKSKPREHRDDVQPVRRGADASPHTRVLQAAQKLPDARQRLNSDLGYDLPVERLLAQRKAADVLRIATPLQQVGNDPFVLFPESTQEVTGREQLPDFMRQSFPALLMMPRGINDDAIPIKNHSIAWVHRQRCPAGGTTQPERRSSSKSNHAAALDFRCCRRNRVRLSGAVKDLDACFRALREPGTPLPSDLFTADTLSRKNESGTSVLHVAAKHGRLREFPAAVVTESRLRQKNDAGYTPLHLAALSGHLTQVPAGLITADSLRVRSNSGFTVLHCAASGGHLAQLPAAQLTPEALRLRNDLGETLLHVAAEHGTLDRIPRSLLTVEALAERTISGETVFHVAAMNGNLTQIPVALTSDEALRTTTSAGDTVFHAAAIAGHLGTLPPASLTRDHLALRSKSGYSVIHAAAETGQLQFIPPQQLTADLLLTKNDHGDTPLHAAAFEGHLDQVPAQLLTPESMNVRNYDGATPRQTAIDRGFQDQLPDELQPGGLQRLKRFLRLKR